MILVGEKDDLVGFSFFIIGAIFGSFNSMVVFRVVNNIPFLNPLFSVCLNCNKKIKFYDNIPLISYILLGGKCRYCNVKYSINYFFIELISALVTYFSYKKFGISPYLVIFCVVSYLLIILSFIDLYKREVPYILLILVVISSFFYNEFDFYNFLFGVGFAYMLNFFVSFYIQEIKSKLIKKDLSNQEALGEGDIPIFGIIAGFLDIKYFFITILISALFSLIPSLYLNIKKQQIELPFIPFLTCGFFIIFLGDSFWF